MNLKDAFAGIREAQEPESLGAQAPRSLGAQEPRSLRAEAPKRPGAQAPKRLGTQEPKRLPVQGTAKSKHPDFEAVKIYIRSETRRRAFRKWEDAQGGDFSELVEELLNRYVGA